jgi:hypothetical protein
MYKIENGEKFRKILPLRNELLLGGINGCLFVFDIKKATFNHKWHI